MVHQNGNKLRSLMAFDPSKYSCRTAKEIGFEPTENLLQL
jgi:hypothetical protein